MYNISEEEVIQPVKDYIEYDLSAMGQESKAVMMEQFDDHVNRDSKDSIFCDLFSKPEYCLQLYQALHPEDRTVTADHIVLVTLSSMMMKYRYNDVGILVRDKLLVLVEAQSTFTVNILIRFLLYLSDTYTRYIGRKSSG